jgi:hypothetical protein
MLDLITGRRELGKTTLAVHLSRHSATRVIFDPRHMIEVGGLVLTDDSVDMLYKMLDVHSEVIIRPFNKERVFEETCRQIYNWLSDNPGEPFCFLLDEARFIKAPEDNLHFDFIVRCTPRSSTTVIITCHGIVDVSTDLRRIADYWILFRLTLEADVDRVRERCGDAVAEEVTKLQPFEYIVWNDANATWSKHTDRTKWFVRMTGAVYHGINT